LREGGVLFLRPGRFLPFIFPHFVREEIEMSPSPFPCLRLVVFFFVGYPAGGENPFFPVAVRTFSSRARKGVLASFLPLGDVFPPPPNEPLGLL